jgi:hypothetical protein
MTPGGGALIGAAARFVLSWLSRAHAQMAAAADVNMAFPAPDANAGYGGALRFGYRTGLGHQSLIHTIIFQPEVALGGIYLPSLAPTLRYENQA